MIRVAPLPEGQFEFPHDVPPADAPTHNQLATFLAGRDMIWPINSEGYPSMFNRGDLRQDLQVLWLLVCNSLMPTTQHAYINLSHARVMHAIVMQRPFCLVRFFIQQIASVYESTNQKDSIKMGILITHFCKMFDVQSMGRDVKRRQLGAIDISTLNRRRGQTRNRAPDVPAGGEAAEAVDPAEAEEEEEEPHTETSTARRQKRKAQSGPVPMDMDALMGKLDEMHVMYQSHFTSAAENDQRFRDQYNQDMASITAGFRIQSERYGVMNTRMGAMETRMAGMHDELGTIRNDVAAGFTTMEAQMEELMNRFATPPDSPSPGF